MSQWEVVYKDTLMYRVEMVKDILEKNEIMAVVMNKKISGYEIGNFELNVRQGDVLSALKIIKENISFG